MSIVPYSCVRMAEECAESPVRGDSSEVVYLSDERLAGFVDGATAAGVRIASDEYLQGYVSGSNAAIRARDDQSDAADAAAISGRSSGGDHAHDEPGVSHQMRYGVYAARETTMRRGILARLRPCLGWMVRA